MLQAFQGLQTNHRLGNVWYQSMTRTELIKIKKSQSMTRTELIKIKPVKCFTACLSVNLLLLLIIQLRIMDHADRRHYLGNTSLVCPFFPQQDFPSFPLLICAPAIPSCTSVAGQTQVSLHLLFTPAKPHSAPVIGLLFFI